MFAGRRTEGLDRHSIVGLPLTRRHASREAGRCSSMAQSKEETMRRFGLVLCCGLFALIAIAAPRPAAAQDTDSKGKNCRMEQQCHWQDFKKICVWVKVCR
jgi:hypothetical protein